MLFDRSLQVVDVARKAHHLAWSENNFGFQRNLHAPEDLEELLDMLRPADVNATKLNLVFEPQLFAKNIISRTFEKQMFHDGEDKFQINEYVRFAAILTDKLAAVYGSQGSVRLNTATLYKQIIEVGQAHLTTEVYDTLVKEAVNARPDAAYELSLVIRGKDQEVQQTPMNKFISVLEEIARVAEPYIKQQRLVQEKRKSSDFGSTKAFDKISQRMYRALKKKAPQLQEIFQQVANHDPSQLLRFFASFRNHLVLNPELKALQEFESIWIEVLAEAITILPLINSFTDPMEKILYLTKIAVALNSDTLNDDYYFEFAELVEKGAFTFEGLKKLYQFFSNPDQLYAEVEVPLRNEEYFFADSWDYTSREAIYLLLQKSLELPQEEFSHELERLTLEFPLNHYGVNISSALNENEETPPLVESRKSSVLKRALSQYEFDLTNPQHLRDLYFISTYLDDINFAMRLQAVIWQKLTAMISFSESMSFIEREIKDRRLLSLRSFSHLVEERAYSHEEIDEARQTMMQLLTHESTSINFGRMILAEQFLDRIFTRHKADLLLACLDNDGDRALKEYLYASWKESYQIDPLVVEAVNLEDILQRFYRLDGQSKYILLRNLLCGEGGVLVDKDKKERGKLIDYFLDNYVEATNKTERKYLEVTRNVMREFAINARFDSLYFALAPLLQERILVPPTKRISWKYVIKEQGAPPDFYRVTSNGKEISDHKKVLRTITGRRQDKQRLSYEQERGEYEARIEALLGQLEGLPMQTKINVMELPLEFAKSLGAPAVRILQASLQYLELPKDAEDKAQAVYDNVPGQSKISGHYTLTSQWPQARAELTGIGKKIGGGSLNTVWQTDNLAVKVLNPNAQFHTDTTCELLAQIFTILAREDRRFEPLLTAVDDIQQWIKEDINFQGFLEADKRFKEKHDGFTLGGRYVVKIPKTYEPENSKFMLEDYIEGFNLTQSTELKLQGHDLREIITLLTRNFFAQIKDGQVLSNIHPGNVRVRGNEVVILDRNYYLDLNMNDKLFLAGLVQNLNNIPFVTELCLSYLIQQGVEIDSRQRARIKKRINTLSQITDPSDRLLGLSVTLRKEKLRFPLKITLLVQDFFYLDRMAKKVDYSGILDAYEGQVND